MLGLEDQPKTEDRLLPLYRLIAHRRQQLNKVCMHDDQHELPPARTQRRLRREQVAVAAGGAGQAHNLVASRCVETERSSLVCHPETDALLYELCTKYGWCLPRWFAAQRCEQHVCSDVREAQDLTEVTEQSSGRGRELRCHSDNES